MMILVGVSLYIHPIPNVILTFAPWFGHGFKLYENTKRHSVIFNFKAINRYHILISYVERRMKLEDL